MEYAIIPICDVFNDCFYFIFWWTDDFSWNDESWRIDWFFKLCHADIKCIDDDF